MQADHAPHRLLRILRPWRQIEAHQFEVGLHTLNVLWRLPTALALPLRLGFVAALAGRALLNLSLTGSR
jgi:hypothetical protein